MELELPVDMLWDGKMEPLSPSQLANTSFAELEQFEDNFAEEFFLDESLLHSNKIANYEKLYEIIQLSNEASLDEDDVIYKDDQWCDVKSNASYIEEYNTEQPIGFYPVKTTNTDDLILEFESVFDAVEYTHLTPPQTPPEVKQKSSFNNQTDYESLYAVNEIPIDFQPATILSLKHDKTQSIFQNQIQLIPQHQHNEQLQQPQPHIQTDELFTFPFNANTTGTVNDLAEMEVVEELLRTCGKNNISDLNDDDDSYGSGSSNSSVCFSPRSDISFADSKGSHEDEDWYPNHSGSSLSSLSSSRKSSSTSKRKTKSHGRTVEDRKIRKKEQNKNAATRYRQKKKQEIEEILGEERALQETNKKLQSNYNDLRREIKYLKSLMRELCNAKGLLK